VSAGTSEAQKGARAWAERWGRRSWRRARVRARWSTVGTGRVELTGEAHGAERETGGAWGNGSAPGRAGPRGREGRGGVGEETCTDNSAPLARAREREESVGQSAADRRPPVRGGRRAGARGWAWWAGLGQNGFLFFLNFLIAFPFLFSRVFNQIQFKFQIQTNSNMRNNSNNI
jgi:hypothetical protein